MGVRVTKRHNADGSITKRTTITRKTVFGTTKSETFVERIPAKKGCYVATCVYGSYDCPEVWVLRRYRDNTLSKTAPGRVFIRLYYSTSPTFVRLFGKTKWFRNVCREVLDKIVKRLSASGVKDTPYNDAEL